MADTPFKSGQRVAIGADLGTVLRWRKAMGPREGAMLLYTPVRYDGDARDLMVPTGLLSGVA